MANPENEAVETASNHPNPNASGNSSDEESKDSLSTSNITPRKESRLAGNDDASSPESFVSPATAPDASLDNVSSSAVSSQWQLFAQKESNLEALLQHSFAKISELVVASSAMATFNQTNDHIQHEGRPSNSSQLQGQSVNMGGTALGDNQDSSTLPASIMREVVEQEKATNALLKQENLTLESKYKDSNEEIEKLQQTIAKQLDEIEQSKQEVQLAHQEAKKYQAQAKESRNQKEALAMQLQNLQVVVQETKKSSQLLIDQQDEITQMARTMEEHYIQSQATSIQQKRQHSQLVQEHQTLEQDKQTLQEKVQSLQKKIKAKDQEIQEHWKQSVKTLQQKQVWNTQRIESLEQELQESKTLTLQALTTTAQSQATSQQLETEIATLQSALEENQKEAQSNQDQARLELQTSAKKHHAQQQTNQKLITHLKQVQHQCQDFGLELAAMEQLLQEQQREHKRAAAISPAASASSTNQVLCAHKCRAIPQVGWARSTSPSQKSIQTITPTNNHGDDTATICIVPAAQPLYVCLHCVQAIAHPILTVTSKRSSRKRRKVAAGAKKTAPNGNEADASADPKESNDASSGTRTNSTHKENVPAQAMPAGPKTTGLDDTTPSPKTRLTSAVARMVGPSNNNNKASNSGK